MNEPPAPARALTFPELAEARRKTEIISQFLRAQLVGYLETLRPILAPERLLGKHAGGRTDAAGMDQALAQLQQTYRLVSGKPLDLAAEFDPYWLTLTGTQLDLYPWEYAHPIKTNQDTRTITMSSPVRWVISYRSAYGLAQMRQALASQGERRPEHLRQFAINALVMQLLVTKNPGLGALFTDLRYQLQVEQYSDLGRLPLVTITSCLPSFRPADDLILAATTFSGIPAFMEIIDLAAVHNGQDPLAARIQQLLG